MLSKDDFAPPGYVYLIHFDNPISENHTCQHYLGWTTDLPRRIAEHRAGGGCRLTQVAIERDIYFQVVRTWRGFRSQEKHLKRQHNSPRLCPVCNRGAGIFPRK
jgi:predicted GIY-YIG superfamily endonuclease